MNQFIHEYYVRPIASAIQNPGLLFCSIKNENRKSPVHALGIVIVSSSISALAGTLMSQKTNFFILYFVFFVNALGMMFISSGLGYLIAKIVVRPSVKMAPILNIYALSFAVTLLFSWIPYSIWLTEPWKWWLIGTGLINGIGIEFWRALLIIILSISVMIGLFWVVFKII